MTGAGAPLCRTISEESENGVFVHARALRSFWRSCKRSLVRGSLMILIYNSRRDAVCRYLLASPPSLPRKGRPQDSRTKPSTVLVSDVEHRRYYLPHVGVVCCAMLTRFEIISTHSDPRRGWHSERLCEASMHDIPSRQMRYTDGNKQKTTSFVLLLPPEKS